MNLIGVGECFGEMSYIRDGMPRQATIESLTKIIITKFDNTKLERTSPGCQIHFTRAIVRTLVERLELANTRVAPAVKT